MILQEPFAVHVVNVYTRALTIDHTQVPSTQSNFPVLVNFTNTTLKTLVNGGHVSNANGYDIGFFSDSGGTTPLKWEVELYVATTGQLVAWVKIASVSSSSDTVFYMRYGSKTITTDQSDPTNVWTNSFTAVYHLKDGTTLSAADSTGSHNGTNVNAVTATTGQIDGAGSFASASSQYIDTTNGVSTAAVTLSVWGNATTLSTAYSMPIGWNSGNTNYARILVKSTGKLAMSTNAANYDGTGSNTLSTGTTYYLVLTYSSAAGLVGYVNGASDHTAAAGAALSAGAFNSSIGRDPANAGVYWNGKLDEGRYASVVRSADWITCEYNNQQTSSTFVALGSET